MNLVEIGEQQGSKSVLDQIKEEKEIIVCFIKTRRPKRKKKRSTVVIRIKVIFFGEGN